ncbi:hypothetical protein ACA910_020706 [Epithemia clementina (nom. ined.)]
MSPLEALGNVLLFLLVFGMSATVSTDNMRSQLQNTKAILTGLLLQFLVLPFLGFATVKILRLDDTMGITLLVVTSSPGGSYSNWWCSMFNADLALSVTMTTISTLLSIVMLPINLLLYANQAYEADVVAALDWEALFLSLFIVISAIGLGLASAASITWPPFQKFANKLGNLAGLALVVFSFTVCSSDTESDLIGRDWEFYVGVAAPIVFGLIVSIVLSSYFNLQKPERVTVAVECCYQNTGIATSIAITAFSGPELAEALGVPLYYGILEAVILGVYCLVSWKLGWTKAPADENICVVISTNYEEPSKTGEGYEPIASSSDQTV